MKKDNINLIEKALKEVGVEQGDVVLVHSDSTFVREITGLKWDRALNALKDCILNVLGGNGTLIVPTFNWDFCKGKPYSHEKTRSQVGMFTNNILKDERSIRSLHPIYSFSGIGSEVKNIFYNISKSSFGQGSVFQKLHKINAKIIHLNTQDGGWTFAHYVEQMVGVDYRYIKRFKGIISYKNIRNEDKFDMYVRYLNRDIKVYWKRLFDDLSNSGRMKKYVINDRYLITMITCNNLFSLLKDQIIKKPYYLLKHPPKILRKSKIVSTR